MSIRRSLLLLFSRECWLPRDNQPEGSFSLWLEKPLFPQLHLILRVGFALVWSDNIMTHPGRTEDRKLPSAWSYLGREFILLKQHSKLFQQVAGKGTPLRPLWREVQVLRDDQIDDPPESRALGGAPEACWLFWSDIAMGHRVLTQASGWPCHQPFLPLSQWWWLRVFQNGAQETMDQQVYPEAILRHFLDIN